MSLTDLKKSNVKRGKKKQKVDVDDFIDDALNYAKGKPKIVSRSSLVEHKHKEVIKKNYRHATFTLNEQAINKLQYLSDKSGLAKSHIVRILLDSDPDIALKNKLMALLNDEFVD